MYFLPFSTNTLIFILFLSQHTQDLLPGGKREGQSPVSVAGGLTPLRVCDLFVASSPSKGS